VAACIGLTSYLFCFFVFGHHYFSLDFVRAGNVFVVLAYLAFPVVNFYHYKTNIKKTINELKLVAMNAQINRQRMEIMQQNAKLREMNQMKDQFFSIILGFMELAVKNIENGEKADRFIKMAYQSTTTSYQLLEDLMEWTHLQSEKTNYQPENIPLRDLAAECGKDLANIAEYKKIELTSSISAHETAFINRNLLKTVIRNLLTNAIKFTNEGGIVSISSRSNGNLREIHVTDNGVGMCPEKIDQLFKQHKGFTSMGTKSEKGTGLGLTLCKDILEKAGGKIWVESQVGKGSSFKFTVPLLPNISAQ
jgi:signal transduction histidine kinase